MDSSSSHGRVSIVESPCVADYLVMHDTCGATRDQKVAFSRIAATITVALRVVAFIASVVTVVVVAAVISAVAVVVVVISSHTSGSAIKST